MNRGSAKPPAVTKPPAAPKRTRAEASRANGARSNGPKTALGKSRAAQNALKHGLRAGGSVVLASEDGADFARFAAALRVELRPVGLFEEDLAARVAIAAWRARRADRIEAALLDRYLAGGLGAMTGAMNSGAGAAGADLAVAVLRDAHGPRAIETLLRYRGSVQSELFRALGALKALQAERAAEEAAGNESEAQTVESRPPTLRVGSR